MSERPAPCDPPQRVFSRCAHSSWPFPGLWKLTVHPLQIYFSKFPGYEISEIWEPVKNQLNPSKIIQNPTKIHASLRPSLHIDLQCASRRNSSNQAGCTFHHVQLSICQKVYSHLGICSTSVATYRTMVPWFWSKKEQKRTSLEGWNLGENRIPSFLEVWKIYTPKN